MPDISMCRNKECKKKYDCYRYMAVPNPWRQSFASFTHEDCEYFWPLKDASTKVHTIDEVKKFEQREV